MPYKDPAARREAVRRYRRRQRAARELHAREAARVWRADPAAPAEPPSKRGLLVLVGGIVGILALVFVGVRASMGPPPVARYHT